MKSNSILIPLTVAALCAAEAFAAPMGTAFTYQGRLNDGGQPANNLYDLTFTLHDDALNPATVGTYIILTAVPVTNGLFTVELNAGSEFGPNAFNGAARWLQIGVRTNSNNAFNNFTFLSPRQPLTAAPYALFASNALASLNASMASNVIDGAITGSKLAPGAVTWSGISGIPAGFVDGVDNDTTYSAGAGLNLSGANQFSVNFAGAGSANAASRSDHHHFGAIWAGNTAFGVGLSVTNSAANATGLYGQQGTGSGFPYIFGNTAGVWGESTEGSGVYGASSTFRGVQGVSLGTNGSGVYGIALRTTGTNYGVYGRSYSMNGGAGTFGQGSVEATDPNKGLLKLFSIGVMGDSANGMGVAGVSDHSYGVYGRSVENSGISGYSANFIGIDGQAGSAAGIGIRAINNSGVAFKAAGTGIIQSDADSVHWLPAIFPKSDGGNSTPHFFANAVSVKVTPNQTGSTAWAMSLNLPGTLYGQNVTVKSIDIYYKCSNGARSYASGASLYSVNTDGTFTSSFVSGGTTGNAAVTMTLTPNKQLSATQGFMSLLLSAQFGDMSDSIDFYGVRVVISHH
jgi:hypothetical protein